MNITEGHYFGEIDMLFESTRTETAKTVSNCELLVMSRDNFLSICVEYPKIKESIITIASERKKIKLKLLNKARDDYDK